MRAHSIDLHERVVAAVDAGMTHPQAAARFGVSVRSVARYLARRRATGSLAATEQRHGPEPRKKQQLHAWLPARLDEVADATLAEHVAAFVADGGQPVSLASMSRAGAAAGPAAAAKTLSATEWDEDAHARWRNRRAGLDPAG